MSEKTSWFDDDGALAEAIGEFVVAYSPAITIPGYTDPWQIGRGGQGVIWAARQVSTGRRVAIKVLRDEFLASETAQRRFEREVDLVLVLDHPNIVKVFDRGHLEDGRHFVVMELIDGVAIDAREEVVGLRTEGPRSRSGRKALRMFADIVDAVAHAHRRGVLHRDLKPSNVRVSRDGTPHVLDFGLAKSLIAHAPSLTEAHSQRAFIGSLPWASPEQARGDVAAIDVRSDVYSLGVMLYHLATGRYPYDVEGSLDVVLSNIVNALPDRPSRSNRRIDRGLESIILECLAKDPARRYASAGDLARDLSAYLDGRPLAATSGGFLPSLVASIRRHRVIAGAATLIVLLSSAFGVVSLQLREEALRERDAAEVAGKRARTSFDFLVDVLGNADPDRSGSEARVVDALDRAAKDVDRRFADSPIEAMLFHDALFDLYSRLGRYEEAERESGLVLDIAKRGRADDDPTVLRAASRWCLARHRCGSSAEVASELESILDRQRRTPGAISEDLQATLTTLGLVLQRIERSDEARRPLEEALELARSSADSSPVIFVSALANLAANARASGDIDLAVQRGREALEESRRLLGTDHSSTLKLGSDLVVYLLDAGRSEEALPLMREGVASLEARLGETHPSTLIAISNLAKACHDQKHLEEAESEYRKSLAGLEKVEGPDGAHVITTLNNLAAVLVDLNRAEEAKGMMERVVETRRRTSGATHSDTFIAVNNLASLISRAGDYESAERLFRENAAASRSTLGESHWMAAVFAMTHGKCLAKLSRHGEAESVLLDALRVLEEKLGQSHIHTKTARRALYDTLRDAGRTEDAERYREPDSRP